MVAPKPDVSPWAVSLDRRWWATALALTLPTIFIGFQLDDWWQLAYLKEHTVAESTKNLFQFVPLPDGVGAALPWWSDPNLQLAFFRPLSSFLAALDWRLFGTWAMGYHLHSLLWFVILIGITRKLFHRILPFPVAVWATLWFVADDVTIFPVAWLANRNALLALVFGMYGLYRYFDGRESGKLWIWAALPGWIGALLSGEFGLGVFAYVAAYEAFGAKEGWKERLQGLAIPAVLVVSYLLFYRNAGYGAIASGAYLDPGHETLDWLMTAPPRMSALLACLLVGLPADWWMVAEWLKPALVLGGIIAVGQWIWLWKPLWPQISGDERRWLTVMGWGACLALIPVLSVFPANRLLGWAALGGATAMGVVVRHVRRTGDTELDPGPPRRMFIFSLAVATLFAAPLVWWGQAHLARTQTQRLEQRALQAEIRPGDRDVFLLAAPEPLSAYYLPAIRFMRGESLPIRFTAWSLAMAEQRVTRTGEWSIEIEVIDGRMLDTEFERLLRRRKVTAGEEFERQGYKVTVLESDDVGPTRVAFSWETAESPVFLAWRDGKLRRIELPSIGGELVLPNPGSLWLDAP